jgi:MerR family transcriptional regulator, light-induced transcriptional regulator
VSLYRIGTAARLSGLPVATLRNWEQRYGDVKAARSGGKQRLYSREDIDQLRQLKDWVDGGLSAGEAHALLRERSSRGLATGALASSRWVREAAQRARANAAAAHSRAEAGRARAIETLEALADRQVPPRGSPPG